MMGGVMGKTVFWAIVRKVQTLTDGSLNVTFNLPEDAIPEAAELMAYQIHGVVVDLTVAPRPEKQVRTGEQAGNVAEGPKRKSKWTTAEE